MKDFLKRIGIDIRNLLGVVYVFLILALMYVLTYHAVPADNKDLVNIFGGHVMSGLGLILAYYFGASKKEKDSTDKKDDVK